MTPDPQDSIEFKVFLSHRYKSPDVNLFFFKLLSHDANVHFEVDVGVSATNVTRIERMIRDSDAFIGIYPLPINPNQMETQQDRLKASRYFRLELDLAIRARKPILVFFDQRFGNVMDLPERAISIPYDNQEILGTGGVPQEKRYKRGIEDFYRYVRASMMAEAESPLVSPHARIGLLVPREGASSGKYEENEIQLIQQVAQDHQINELKMPPGQLVLNGQMYRWLESLDWVIADVGELAMKSGIVGFLHGAAKPMVRLYKGKASVSQVEKKPTFSFLFGGIEVGYCKDIVFWNSPEVLEQELDKRLQSLRARTERISTWSSAEQYFLKASKRNEAIFVSYSGKDYDIAQEVIKILKRRFQEVFDYKDGSSITPGQPWLKEIFDQLAKSALGVPLLSQNYLDSGNCAHEAEQMVAHQDMGKMLIIPIKIVKDSLDLPSYMENIQYLRHVDYADEKILVDKLIESFDKGLENE